MTRQREQIRGEPRVTAAFDHVDRFYRPGDALAVRYSIGIEAERVRAIEHSILWYTEGKGRKTSACISFSG